MYFFSLASIRGISGRWTALLPDPGQIEKCEVKNKRKETCVYVCVSSFLHLTAQRLFGSMIEINLWTCCAREESREEIFGWRSESCRRTCVSEYT